MIGAGAGAGAGELEKRPNLNRLMTEINSRPASQRAINISASNNHNFKAELDEEASKFMFPHNERLKKHIEFAWLLLTPQS